MNPEPRMVTNPILRLWSLQAVRLGGKAREGSLQVVRLGAGWGEARGAPNSGPALHLHDGTHSSAVALPHAAESGLSPNVPELSEKRATWSQPEAGNQTQWLQFPLLQIARDWSAVHPSCAYTPQSALEVLRSFPTSPSPCSPPASSRVSDTLPNSFLVGAPSQQARRCASVAPRACAQSFGFLTLTLMVTFPLVILRMLKPTVGIISSLNCPDWEGRVRIGKGVQIDRTRLCRPWQPRPQGRKNKAVSQAPLCEGTGASPECPLLSGRTATNNSGVSPVNKRPRLLQAPSKFLSLD